MELDFVRWLRDRLPEDPRLKLGVGDDAAVVALGRPELVTTADLLIDGVHFLTAEHAPERIGRKALAVNLSDLAAMAARPAGALLSLALPRDGACGLSPRELAARLLEGMLPLSEEFGCPIVGGDTNTHAGPLVVAVTAFGEPTERGVVRRDGARPGDVLYVTGELGGSLAGKHLDFTPRVNEALRLRESGTLSAMMDLSDGLSVDLARLCEASGVGALLTANAVPASRAAEDASQQSGRTVLDHALNDGEDFELLAAIPHRPGDETTWLSANHFGLIPIGRIQEDPGVFVKYSDGSTKEITPAGYEHQ